MSHYLPISKLTLCKMSDAWFTWPLAPDGNPEDGCHSQEAAALKDYISSTTITPEAAARNITLPVANEPETAHKGQSSDNLYRLWTLIIDGLTDLPEHRGKIIQLLQAIQNLPLSNGREDEAIGKQIQWADLPNFGHLWSDLMIGAALYVNGHLSNVKGYDRTISSRQP